MSEAVLTLTDINRNVHTFDKLISFKCRKERYTPYSELTVTALCDGGIPDVVKVSFSVGGKFLHFGMTDSLTFTKSGGRQLLRITSRGFSSMLSQNELAPGILSQLSLDSLMSEHMIVPNVTWQPNSDTVRYIYVKEHDSQWSAIVSLALTLTEQYPYIGKVNEVRLYPDNVLAFFPTKVIEEGTGSDYSKMISDYHMKDVNGNYTYAYTDGFAAARGIVRHKYIPFDRQFISLDHLGLKYRLGFSERGCSSRFLTYLGYNGEELRDMVLFPDRTMLEISAIEVCGNAKKGIFTKDICYFDAYCNKAEP